MKKENNKIVIYQAGKNRFEVNIQEDTIWLSRKQMADLFSVDRSVVSRHLKNIYENRELSEKSTCAKNAHVDIPLMHYAENA